MNDSNSKILLIGEFASLNGGERSTMAVVGELARDFRFAAAVPRGGAFAKALESAGVITHPLDFYHGDGSRYPLDQLRAQLADILDDSDPDLVHAISLSTGRIAGPVCQARGLSSIGHLRDIINVSRQVIEDLNSNTLLIAVSQATKQWHVNNGLRSQATQVIYNGVDLDHFSPKPTSFAIHDEIGVRHDVQFITSIGQIGIRKGLDVLLDAFELVCDERPSSHLLVVGQRFSTKAEAVEYERRLLDRSFSGRLKGRVHWVGKRTDVSSILASSTLFVHAARQEPLGRVLLEAGAAGLPIIATDVGGTAEIFPPDDRSCLFVDKDCPRQMADAIRRVLGDAELRCDLGNRARARIERAFDIRSAANRIGQVYRKLLRTGADADMTD